MSKLTSSKPESWNDDQNNVWQSIEAHWDHLINKRVDEFIKYIHPSFIGFGHESPINIDRPWLEKWVGFWTKITEIIICELRPVDIRIHGDIAIVQYFIFTIEKNSEGGKRVIRRYTMTWERGPKHWVVIGSHNNLMDERLYVGRYNTVVMPDKEGPDVNGARLSKKWIKIPKNKPQMTNN